MDHLVYGTADLAATVAELNARLGIELSPGGRHEGMGTRNYLADLGERRYLEVVGPDPEQPDHDGPFFFDVDLLERARLVTWAVRVDDLDAVRERVSLPVPRDMRRESADGSAITWRMTAPMADGEFGGLVPFVIEWGTGSPHPSDSAAHSLALSSLTACTAQPDRLRARLAELGESLPVEQHDVSGLRAVINGPAGQIVLS